MLYVDHAATTPVRPEVVAAMEPHYTETFGNPSGLHAVSRRAKNALEEAREQAATILGAAHPLEIVFTGGGSEADNLAVAGVVLNGSARRDVITAATEHKAVLETAAFLARLGSHVTVTGVDRDGRVDPADIASAVTTNTAVVSVMTANNEVGTIQPVAEMAAAVRRRDGDVLLHTDAVQAFISEPVTVGELGVDMLSLSGHKFGGPQGVGLLYVRNGVELEPVIHGGGQELGRRAGTHNVAGAVGLAAAMQLANEDRADFRHRVGAARDRFEAVLLDKLPDIEINGVGAPRLVQHSHIRFPGRRAETMIIRLDGAGISSAAGSACQSGAIDASHVLTAMGFTDVEADECLRFSFGWVNRAEDGERVALAVIDVLEGL